MNAKDLRKQLKNVIKEETAALLGKEFTEGLAKKCTEDLTRRLNDIEKACSDAIQKQDKRSMAIHGELIRDVKFNIINKLHDMTLTHMAFQELISEKFGQLPEDFDKLLDSRKKEITKKKIAEAEAAQAAKIAGEQTQSQAVPAPQQSTEAQPATEQTV